MKNNRITKGGINLSNRIGNFSFSPFQRDSNHMATESQVREYANSKEMANQLGAMNKSFRPSGFSTGPTDYSEKMG